MRQNCGLLLILFVLLTPIYADSIPVTSGNIYAANFVGSTFRWLGIVGHIIQGIIPPHFYAYDKIDAYYKDNGGKVINIDVPSYSKEFELPLEAHWIMNLPINTTINSLNFENISKEDLEANALFKEEIYHIFYPDYDILHDNPNKTFCCNFTILEMFGKYYKALVINVSDQRPVFLLKYKDGSREYPVIFANPKYRNNAAFKLLIPSRDFSDGDEFQYIYIIPKYAYNLTVWIDGNETTKMPNTALPYRIKVRVMDMLSNNPADVYVAVYEENGNFPVIPTHLNGYIGRGFGYAHTDAQGYAEFVFVPTGYSPDNTYSIKVAVFDPIEGMPLKKVNLTVEDTGNIISMQKKPFATEAELNDLKATINAMVAIINMEYKYSNAAIPKAKVVHIKAITNGSIFPEQIPAKVGAFTIVDAALYDPYFHEITDNVSVEFWENEGLLISSPEFNASPLGYKNKLVKMKIDPHVQLIIAPTKYPPAEDEKAFIRILKDGKEIAKAYLNIDTNLEYDKNWGTYFPISEEVKATINNMVAVLNNVYKAIN